MRQLSTKLAPAFSLAVLLAIPGLLAAQPISTILTSSPNPSMFGQTVTLTATLSNPAESGITTFYDGTTVLGSIDMHGGQAVLTTNTIGSGVRSLTAMFTNFGCCSPSTSPPVLQNNTPQPASGFNSASGFNYGVSSSPHAVAVSDFDGDGNLDVAIADSTNSIVTIWLGDGTGYFYQGDSYTIAAAPVALAVGDFNSDGIPDLAVANGSSISVLLGTGDGSFGTPSNVQTTTNAVAIVVGDFDGNGTADLAFADYATSQVSVLFGDGSGGFSGQIKTGVGSGPVSLATGDFNGDGKLDVVTANFTDDSVTVLLGLGTGHFRTNTYNLGESHVVSVAVADLNGDTYPDIVMARSDSSMIIMLGSQTGDFTPGSPLTLANTPSSIALGDIDGDGKVDVAITESNNDTTDAIEVWYGDGTGGFGPHAAYEVHQNPVAVAIEDFNGDGRADLVSANLGAGDFTYLSGIPVPTATATTLTSSANPSSLHQDVTLTAAVFPFSDNGTVTFWQGEIEVNRLNLTGGMAQTVLSNLPLGSIPYTAVYSGLVDIGSTSNILNQQVIESVATTTTLSAAPNPSTIGAPVTFTATISNSLATGTVVFMDGVTQLNIAPLSSGTASYSTSALVLGPHSITAVYSGDAGDKSSTSSVLTQTVYVDITVLTSSQTPITYGHPVTLTASTTPNTSTGSITLYDGTTLLETLPLSGGPVTFTTSLLASGTRSLKAYYSGDINETAGYSSPLLQVVTPVAGAGMFPQTPVDTGATPSSVVIADFTGDGIPDMAFLNTGDNTVSVLAGDGTGSFAATPVSLITLPHIVESLAAGDFNGDGLMDLVVGTSQGFQVVLNSGSGIFGTPRTAVATGFNDINSIAVADFNQDGIADVVIIDQDNSIIQIFLGTGNGLFSHGWNLGDNYNGPNDNGANPTTVAVGDFNNDGIADLAVIDNANNVVSVFLGDGAGNFGTQGNFPVGNSPTSLAVADLNGDGKFDIVVTNQNDDQVGVLLGDGTGSFATEVVYAAGNQPTSILVADFNGDGHIDVAVANAQSNLVSVLLGDGTGILGAAMAYGAGHSNSIAVADFNGDGRADLVSVGNNGLDQMVVLLAAVPTVTTISSNPSTSIYGQNVTFSGTVSPTPISGTVTVMDGLVVLNSGAVTGGTYSIDVNTIVVGTQSITAVYSGDATSPGSVSPVPAVQIVTALDSTTALSSSANPSAAGQGVTFTATVSSTLATGTVSFYDNNVLLGASSPLSGGVGTYLTTLLSPGTHSITATYTTDGNVNSSTSSQLSQIVGAAGVTTTALTSTPNPSIQGQIVSFTATVSNPLAGGSISFMDGSNLLANVNVDSGSAHFGDFNILAGKHAMTAVYSGDLSNLPSTSPVYYQIVNPSVTTLSSSAPSVVFGHSLTLTATVTGQSPTGKVSFYDGSAILETAAIVNGTATLSTAALASGTRSLTAYYIGDGANAPSGSAPVTQNVTPVAESSMTAFWQAPARPNPISLILGDFSGDGIADLAFIHNGLGEISVLIGDGAGSFTGPNASTITYDEAPLLIASGDFNGDGLMDLAVVTYHGLYTVLSTGGGNFALPSASVTTTLTVSSITTGDFNGDGNDDVILTDAVHGTVQVFLGDGTGLFTSGWSYSNHNMSPVAVAAADFNGDGIADIAVLSNASINDVSTNSANIMLGAGDGTFGAPLSFDVGNDPTSIVAAHFVGQGQTDLVVVNQDDNTISLLAGIGTGSFLPQVTYAAPNSPQTVVAADFNADGYPDIALANADSGSEHALISVLLNDQAGHFGTPIGYGAGISTAIAVGDFNGDGKADLATVARPGGPVLVVVLLGTAATTTTIASTPNPSTYGQSVTFTGSVSPASVTGSVTLMDGLNVLATGPVSAGTYSIASNTLSVSTHSITAVYGGDSGDVSSTSTALSQVVYGASSTTTALSSSANPSSYTQSVTITAIVSPPLAIGTVSFYDNLTLLGASGITGGIATFTTSALGIGTHSITANYSGDENFGPSVAPAFSQIVNATAPTMTTLLSSRNPSELGHVVVLTASVSPNSATGSIAFMDGANLLSTVNLANGTAALSTSTLALNTHSLTAVYSGDLADGTSVSPILVQTVSPGTSITLTAPSASSPYGQPVTLTATVGIPGAQGKVTFYDGTTTLGTKTMVDQSASLPALLASGTRSLTALYEGSQGTNAPGSSAVLTHAVTALPEAGFDATLMAYRTGNTPWALATADLNGDGHPDLIVTNKDDLTVSVFIANTNGTFQVGVPYSVGNNPLSVAVADFNGDGFADLVVVNQTDNNVSVLLGDGTGAFAGQVTYSTGAGGSPSSVAAGDFNRDGVPDLAVTNQDTGTVAVMLGVGDGTFLPPVPYSVGTQPVSVAVGDFNNDGYADLAVVNQQDNNASLLLGSGDGTFQTALTYAVGEGPIAVVVADFNNDGFEDVAIANNSLSDNGVSVLFGDGSGTLGPRNTFEMDNNPSNLAVGDFNGDGYPDIALSSRTHDSVTVLLSTNGAFSSTYAYNSQSTLQGLAVADFNGDGITDLAATNSSGGLIVLTGLAPSRTTLTSSLNPSVVGQLVTLTATVTPVPLSGSVQFADFGSGTLGTQPLVDGIAVLTTSTLAAGNHFINASYSGNATLARSSGFVFQVVNTAGASPTTTLLTSSQSSAPFGQAVILTATVSAESATGIVQFIDGASILGSATVTNQVAVLSWSAFSVGFHSLTAIYSGDANNLSSTSSALPQTVTPANGCGITAEPAIFSDSVGGPQTLTITSTQPSCTWEASTSTPWISLSGSGGTGSGTLTVTVAPQTNPAVARTGAIQLASQSIVVTQRITATTFSDVPPDATYFDAANMLFTNHITEGCGGSPIEFCPTADIPRWEMAVLIVRAIFGGDNFPSAGTNPYFNDVPLGDPGFAWIQKLAQLGITSGCGNGNYCPAEFVPRDEAAVFTTRMRYGATAVFDFPPVAYFTDVTPQTFGWVSIQRMREDNITSGCAPTLFCPSDLVTRADMAEFIMRAEFNQFLPAGAPAISTISPATITHGNTATYTVTGLNTNFVQGVTDLAPMAGITIGAVTVNSPTSLTVTLTAASDAALQPVSLVAITGAPPGNEEAALPNGLVIQ